MKKLLINTVFFVVTLLGACASDLEERESEQVKLWELKIAEVSEMNPSEKLGNLSLGLRNMGYRKSFEGHSPAVDRIFQQLQAEMLSIPGHARYFANQLVAARTRTEKPWLDNDYQTIHHRILEIMVHLPSPETVWVLGEMLESEEDLWTREERVAIWREQGSKGFESSIIPSPRGFAGGVLQKIGLREYPEYPSHKWKEAPLPWWQEVKSGKRTISFKGQSVEYRFKPDGTWDTIPIANPPDDRPTASEATTSAPPAANIQSSPTQKQPRSGPWVWIIFCMLGGMAAVVWIGLRRTA